MAATRFRLAAGQRHIDVARLVDLKALADGFNAAERLEQLAQPVRNRTWTSGDDSSNGLDATH